MPNEYDLVVIGAGPAGYVGAVHAARLGLKTAVVEAERIGGVCLNWGCIPTKAILHRAEIYDLARSRGGRSDCGIRGENIRADFGVAAEKARQASDRLTRGIEYLFRSHSVDLIAGRGRLANGRTVVMAPADGGPEREIRAPRILLATGSRPRMLPGLAFDGRRVIASRQAIELAEVPRSVVIVGAGAVGLEFASLWASYGSAVTVVEMEPQILPGADEDQAVELQKALARRGVRILTGSVCREIELDDNGVKTGVARHTTTAGIEKGNTAETVEAERMLVAVGVIPNSEGLGLETLGIAVENGFVCVGPDFRTACETVWAVGDLIGPPLLAHAASAEAIAAVEAMAGRSNRRINYRAIPTCVYCQPEAASVGWTERRARAEGLNVGMTKSPFLANGKAVAMGLTDGFAKLVFDADTHAILGCHMVGHGVSELINLTALAISAGLKVEDVAHAIYAHPTRAELIGDTAREALRGL